MANKFAEDIRRIARGTRYRDPLGLYQPRDPIGEVSVSLITDPLALGGGYGDGGLNNETPTGGAPNSGTEQDANQGDQNPPTDPNNPDSFYKGGAGDGADSAAGEGSFDVEDIIDGTAGPQTSIDGTSGGVNEFTGMKDCETDTPFSFHPDGFFPTPDGWDDADTPPLLQSEQDAPYDPDYYWKYTLGGDDYKSFALAVAADLAEQDSVQPNRSGHTYLSLDSITSAGGVPTYNYTFQYTVTSTGATETQGGTIFRFSCGGGGAPSFCGDDPDLYEPLTEEYWPEDGTFDLANKDGNIVTSEYDADKPADYSSSAKDFCFGTGRTGKILVTADGGTMIYETSGGAPIGTAKVYSPDGTMLAAGDATETFTSQYLPK